MIATYCSKANRMSRSHDENGSTRVNMYSLGVTDLDLSISPDVFGLRAFDKTKAVTRMLQLWRCPVTWCSVWKGSGRACLEHLAEKHGGSTLEIKTNVAQFSPLGQ